MTACAVLGAASGRGVTRCPEARPVILPVCDTPPAEDVASATRAVDLVICLDTSGSMDGLIDAARQRIWSLVNDLAVANPRPALRVGVISFGHSTYSEAEGWTRVIVPLTGDLDEVSEKLFGLTTDGGTEYVGRAIHVATTGLEWTAEAGALKLIVVAGNEEADQDTTVTYQDACAAAIAKGIMVNTIYCGDANDAVAPGWRDVARLADGEYAAIDQHRNTVPATPHDEALATLSAALNETYVAYGTAGRAREENQARQDANAMAASPSAAAERANVKAGAMYRAASWDLVDAVLGAEEGARVNLADLKAEELPEVLRGKTTAEQRAFLEAKQRARAEIQRRIGEEHAKRVAYLEEARAAEGGTGDFGTALRDAVRRQAGKKGFRWEK